MKRMIIAFLLCAILLLSGCGRLDAIVDAFLGNDQSHDVETNQNIVISGDGSFMIPNGTITIISPNGSSTYPPDYFYGNGDGGNSNETIPVEENYSPQKWMCNYWQAYQVGFMQDGYGGGSGFELYLAENGYGVLEWSDGIVSDGIYWINYSSYRLYGRWQVSDDLFQFIVTEDWYDASGVNIGKVLEFPYAPTEDGFILTYGGEPWTFRVSTPHNSYLETVINANGGPTGNDLTGTRQVSESNIDGLVGYWKMYEDDGNGNMIRHLFQFESNGSFNYTRHRMALEGDTWVEVEIVDPYIRQGGYYMLNGAFTIDWDCYEVTGLSVSVNGDTMTMTFVNWYNSHEETGTFIRYDGSDNPQP